MGNDLNDNDGMVPRARALRRDMTVAEKSLWSELRSRKLAGLKFRRQRPIGPYIVDFVCYDPRLVVELDGGQHGERERSEDDVARTEWLNARGFKVIRFWNNDVLQNMDGALETILLGINRLR